VEAELLAALAKSDSGAQELRVQLTDLLLSVDGMHDAIGAAGAELREHLVACLRQLAGQQEETLAKLDALGTEQWRQGRQLRRHTALLEEMVDRQRWMMRARAGRPDQASSGLPPSVTHCGPPATNFAEERRCHPGSSSCPVTSSWSRASRWQAI